MSTFSTELLAYLKASHASEHGFNVPLEAVIETLLERVGENAHPTKILGKGTFAVVWWLKGQGDKVLKITRDRMDARAMQALKDHPKVLSGKILAIVSPEIEGHTTSKIPFGAESGHGYRSMPKVMASSYSCPYEIYSINNYETKYYILLRIAASQSITFIYTVNPSTVLLLAQKLGQYTERIIRDVRDGTLNPEQPAPSDLHNLLKPYTRPDIEQARFLEKAAKKGGGILLPKYVWPKLAAIGCWKGGSVGIYLSGFSQYYPENIPVRDCGYYASEHRGSVPVTDEGSSGILAIPTNVYEFYPADRDEKPQGEDLLRAHQLKKGKQYFVYVTTMAGLYRYDMNDIIEVTGFYEKTPLIRFVQKGKGVVSFTGEKLYEAQVMAAVEKAFQTYTGNFEFIAAVGQMREEVPGYLFLVEFENQPQESESRKLAYRIEKALCEFNIEYETKRKSGRLEPIMLGVVRHGTFYAYRKRSVENGKKDGQFKILKLTEDKDFAGNFPVEKTFNAEI